MAELAAHFHVRPWEWPEMALVDTYVLLANVDAMRTANSG